VPVVIAGKTYTFLLDTGAGYTILDFHIASTLTQSLPDNEVPAIIQQSFDHGVGTAGQSLGKEDTTFWRPLPMRIGDHESRNATPWIGLDLSHLTQALGVRVDGIIGADMIRQLNWKVDNKARTLTVFPDTPSLLGYEQCVPYSSSYGNAPDLRFDMKNGQWLTLGVDTGAMDLLLGSDTLNNLHAHGVDIEPIGQIALASGKGTDDVSRYLVRGLIFNGAMLGKMLAVENPGNVDNLGTVFLSRLDSYLLDSADMLFCYNASTLSRDDQNSMRFVALVVQDGRVEIGGNDPKDIDGYGFRNGDILLEVNQQEARPREIGELREKIENTPAGQLKVVIERQGVKQNVAI